MKIKTVDTSTDNDILKLILTTRQFQEFKHPEIINWNAPDGGSKKSKSKKSKKSKSKKSKSKKSKSKRF